MQSLKKRFESIETIPSFNRVLQIDTPIMQPAVTDSPNVLHIHTGNYDRLIVSFAGHDHMFGLIPRFIFLNFFEKHFSDIDRHFYTDTRTCSYHKGIPNISNTIDETVAYLKEKIAPYKKVIFLGVSSGGYAAILFGSLLGVSTVLAFIPQTIRNVQRNVEEKYRDILPYFNSTTQYHLYADTSVKKESDPHHVSQCDRFAIADNVKVIKCKKIDLRIMRDSGELYDIINQLITS